MSKGLQRMLSHHHLKMDAVWEHDPQVYIEARGRQLELGINLQTASKKWKPDRRQLLSEFMGYGDEQMRCAAEVMKTSPDCVTICKGNFKSWQRSTRRTMNCAPSYPFPSPTTRTTVLASC